MAVSNNNHIVGTTQGNEKATISILLSLEVISFLSQNNHYKQKNKFSKTEAFNDLIERYQVALLKSDEMGADLTQLSKAWNWSQLAVKAFVDRLLDFGIIKVEKIVTRKVVSLNSDIFFSSKDKRKP